MDVDRQARQQHYLGAIESLPFSCDRPSASACFKAQAEDFRVKEVLGFSPSQQGEHYFIEIRKTLCNTHEVIAALARFCEVPIKHIGYAGRKDRQAVTEQWFSVPVPIKKTINWAAFDVAGMEILTTDRHQKKLRPGSHELNHFQIRLREVDGCRRDLEQRLQRLCSEGAPNYFGEQRFGNQASNLLLAENWFAGNATVRGRNKRSMLLSAVRAFLFNHYLAERIRQGAWLTIDKGDALNLDGSNSFFYCDDPFAEQPRLRTLDIHPTAPMWGVVASEKISSTLTTQRHEMEQTILSPYQHVLRGLENFGVAYSRRPTRMRVLNLLWHWWSDDLLLEFDLLPGQFATAVLREISRFARVNY